MAQPPGDKFDRFTQITERDSPLQIGIFSWRPEFIRRISELLKSLNCHPIVVSGGGAEALGQFSRCLVNIVDLESQDFFTDDKSSIGTSVVARHWRVAKFMMPLVEDLPDSIFILSSKNYGALLERLERLNLGHYFITEDQNDDDLAKLLYSIIPATGDASFAETSLNFDVDVKVEPLDTDQNDTDNQKLSERLEEVISALRLIGNNEIGGILQELEKISKQIDEIDQTDKPTADFQFEELLFQIIDLIVKVGERLTSRPGVRVVLSGCIGSLLALFTKADPIMMTVTISALWESPDAIKQIIARYRSGSSDG